MVYKWCIVPLCKNTSIKTPQKLFVSVPTNPKRRNKWLQLAGRATNSILSHTNVFMCEDHFDMEKDMINFMKYKMGFSSKILLTDEAVPSKFLCQEDHRNQLGDPAHQGAIFNNRKRRVVVKKIKKGSQVQSQDMTETVQKDDNIVQEAIKPVIETLKTQDIELNIYNSDSTESALSETNEIEELMCLKNTMQLIQRKPLMYTGINKKCFYLMNLLQKHSNIRKEHILLCLKKIRLNTTFSELADNFDISLLYARKLFLINIPIIASLLKQFIVNIDQQIIKKNLPISFRHNNYNNVSCIINCLEIDIQKPSMALHQALTWSENKNRNTVKYLISCTPNGLVNFVSQGFGGRTSDVAVVQNCKFLDRLQPGTVILADRGFRNLEQILNDKGMKLLRLPNVPIGKKLSKQQTKIIASLRIHMECVIKHIRQFHMLKRQSVINLKMLCVLNHVIIIACALKNLRTQN